jgi:hypothetical protein
MSGPERVNQLLNQIADIAAVAGVQGGIDTEAGVFCTKVATSEGRFQAVFARPTGEIFNGRPVVTVFSIARRYPKTKLLAAINNKDLLALLTRNENLVFARYGIQEQKDHYLVVASADHLLETLDAGEFSAAVRFVAVAADECEAERGEDLH